MTEKEENEIVLPPLLNAAAAASGFTVAQIKSRSRQVPLPFVRFMIYELLYMDYHWHTARIGRIFGRDHATVSSGMKQYRQIMQTSVGGYQVERLINDNFNRLIMLPNREQRIRRYMSNIRNLTRGLPQGKANAISNNLDRISLELKKDRPENRRKQHIL